MKYNKDELRYKNPERRKEYQRRYKKEYMKEYRIKNPDKFKELEKSRWKNPKRKEDVDNRRKRGMDYLRSFKKDKKCEKCGWNKHIEILQFHHINPKNKSFALNRNNLNRSIKSINNEMNKCELLCPNCHLWLHNKQNYI